MQVAYLFGVLALLYWIWQRKKPPRALCALCARNVRAPCAPPLVIVIDGEIGAGKSTLLGKLADRLSSRGRRVAMVKEPVEKWVSSGILAEFYKNPVGMAYTFQTFTYVTRIQAMCAAAKDMDVYILERSVWTDIHIFMAAFRAEVGPRVMDWYHQWCHLHERLIPFDLRTARYFYLKPSLEVCMRRIRARHRAGEVSDSKRGEGVGGVTIEYQTRLRRAHEALFEGKSSAEFPAMPAAGRPFPLKNVTVLGPELADLSYDDPEAKAEERIIEAIVACLP